MRKQPFGEFAGKLRCDVVQIRCITTFSEHEAKICTLLFCRMAALLRGLIPSSPLVAVENFFVSCHRCQKQLSWRAPHETMQLTEDRGMMRRTPLFQELLFTMVNSSNPHNYGKDLRYRYRFGVINEVRATRGGWVKYLHGTC